jgi:hypothetical protein
MLSPFLLSPPKIPMPSLLLPVSMRALPPPPRHQLSPHCPSIPLHWGIKPLQDLRPPLPLMPDKAILSHIYSRSHGSLHVYFFGWWFSPWELWEKGGGCLVGWYCCSSHGVANPFSSFSPSPNSSTGVPLLSPMFGCKNLTEPLRRYPYQAPVSKHFSASASVGVWWLQKYW